MSENMICPVCNSAINCSTALWGLGETIVTASCAVCGLETPADNLKDPATRRRLAENHLRNLLEAMRDGMIALKKLKALSIANKPRELYESTLVHVPPVIPYGENIGRPPLHLCDWSLIVELLDRFGLMPDNKPA